jgi:hypothetical protein
VHGKVVRRVHVTLDATIRTATILTQGKAVEVVEAIPSWRRGNEVSTAEARLDPSPQPYFDHLAATVEHRRDTFGTAAGDHASRRCGHTLG